MDFLFPAPARRFFRCEPLHLLSAAWVMGLVFGVFTSGFASASFLSLARSAVFSPVSALGLLLCSLLPLLFSAFAVYISNVPLLMMVAFGKAFFHAYLCLAVLYSFGSAGWLVRLLFLFSDSAVLPLLWLYWLRSVHDGRRDFAFRTVPAICAAILIAGFDYRVIAPFLAQILNF